MSIAETGVPRPRGIAALVFRHRALLLELLVFVPLTVVLFFPYATRPATTVSDPGDPIFLIWTMEWVERALLHTPSQLFDAPQFHPFRDTLAYSDPLIPQALAALPARLVGFGPVFAYNFVLLGSIVLSGVLTTRLFHELTGDRWASIAGALVATFPSARLYHLAHLQLQVTVFWPLSLLLIRRVLERPEPKRAVALSIALAAAPLASMYHAMFMALFLPPFALLAWGVSPGRSRRSLALLLASALGAGILLAPVARIYARALDHLAQTRDVHDWAKLSHYASVSRFADVCRWIPDDWVVRDVTPQWLGGGAAWLLPPAAVAILATAARARLRRSDGSVLPKWARELLPYVALGCLAILVSLPLRSIATWPGIRELRDMQRTVFATAIAGGALIAVGLAELRRRRHPWAHRMTAFTLITTVAPAYSSSLPTYRPPEPEQLEPVYRWLSKQTEPMVIYEVPATEPGEALEFLWASVFHKKRLIDGYSGYFPLTDVALRGEATNAGKPDFWRTLGLLGATHLVVHTERLKALQGGTAALDALRHFAGSFQVASLLGAEVYRVLPVTAAEPTSGPLTRQRPEYTSGRRLSDAPSSCIEVSPRRPFMAYLPETATVSGFAFTAETALGTLDDLLEVERSDDLRTWRASPHRPILSTSVIEYVQKPTQLLRARVVLAPDGGTFLRIASRGPTRLCNLTIEGSAGGTILPVAAGLLHVEGQPGAELGRLALDGDPTTVWNSKGPQIGSESLAIDLGAVREVAAVVLDLGYLPSDYGRELELDCGASPDTFELGAPVEGASALFDQPRIVQVLALAPPRQCRHLRVRQTGRSAAEYWSVAELQVFERPGAQGVMKPLALSTRLDVSSDNIKCQGCWPIEHRDGSALVWTTGQADFSVHGLVAERRYRVTLGLHDTGRAATITFDTGSGPGDPVAAHPGPITLPRPLVAERDGTIRWSVRAPAWRPKDGDSGSTDDRQLGVAIADVLVEEATRE